MNWKYQWIENCWSIIIHHSLTKDGKTVSWNAIREYHINELSYDDIGYHFGIELINNTYEIFVGRPLGTVGAHTKQNNMNKQSVGICFVGNYDVDEVPKEMYDVGANLIAGLCKYTPCNEKYIFPHFSYASYKTCPGIKFDMNRLRNNVMNILTIY